MPRDSGISCENFNFRYTGLELQRQWENVHFRSLFCTPVLPIVGHGPADTLRVSASGASRPRAMPVLKSDQFRIRQMSFRFLKS